LRIFKIYILSIFFALATLSASSAAETFVLDIDSTINPVVADYISTNLNLASEEKVSAVIIKWIRRVGLWIQ
jgi:membrane-bound ClpP family serine protease